MTAPLAKIRPRVIALYEEVEVEQDWREEVRRACTANAENFDRVQQAKSRRFWIVIWSVILTLTVWAANHVSTISVATRQASLGKAGPAHSELTDNCKPVRSNTSGVKP